MHTLAVSVYIVALLSTKVSGQPFYLRELKLTAYFLVFGPFSVNSRDGCPCDCHVIGLLDIIVYKHLNRYNSGSRV